MILKSQKATKRYSQIEKSDNTALLKWKIDEVLNKTKIYIISQERYTVKARIEEEDEHKEEWGVS